MPRPRSVRRTCRIHVVVDEDVYLFFQALNLRPSEGRVGYGVSKIINHLLRQERTRLIEAGNRETNHANEVAVLEG